MHRFRIEKLRLLVVIVSVLILSACNSVPKRDLTYVPPRPSVPYPSPARPTGAIYHTGTATLFFEDIKARRVGDILTIKLVERTDARKSAETTTDRSQTTSISNPTFMGSTPQFDLPGAFPLASTDNNTLEQSLSAEHAFAGKGDSSQSNRLSGDISVTVHDVLPNGNLMVRGEKRININQGNEYIKISGIVRPIDIDARNTVVSTKVADATIVYNGDGQIASANRMAWLARFFISLIFPF